MINPYQPPVPSDPADDPARAGPGALQPRNVVGGVAVVLEIVTGLVLWETVIGRLAPQSFVLRRVAEGSYLAAGALLVMLVDGLIRPHAVVWWPRWRFAIWLGTLIILVWTLAAMGQQLAGPLGATLGYLFAFGLASLPAMVRRTSAARAGRA